MLPSWLRFHHTDILNTWKTSNETGRRLLMKRGVWTMNAGTLLGYGGYSEVRDLYVAGDLYENDVVTPAMIVVPRSRTKRHRHVKEAKKDSWENDVKEKPSFPAPALVPKPVDEDLYKISPELLYAKSKKKRGLSYFTSCLLPTCFGYVYIGFWYDIYSDAPLQRHGKLSCSNILHYSAMEESSITGQGRP